jgi:hypothetical protein
MSARADEFRGHATEVIDRLSSSDDAYTRELAANIAEAYLSLAPSEEWLDGETLHKAARAPMTAPKLDTERTAVACAPRPTLRRKKKPRRRETRASFCMQRRGPT